MPTVQPDTQNAAPDVSAWYWAQIEGLNLKKTDAAAIYQTRAGILRCVLVQPPSPDWPMEVAEEHIRLIKVELSKKLTGGR